MILGETAEAAVDIEAPETEMTRAEADQEIEEESHHPQNHLLDQILLNPVHRKAVVQILLSQRDRHLQDQSKKNNKNYNMQNNLIIYIF